MIFEILMFIMFTIGILVLGLLIYTSGYVDGKYKRWEKWGLKWKV